MGSRRASPAPTRSSSSPPWPAGSASPSTSGRSAGQVGEGDPGGLAVTVAVDQPGRGAPGAIGADVHVSPGEPDHPEQAQLIAAVEQRPEAGAQQLGLPLGSLGELVARARVGSPADLGHPQRGVVADLVNEHPRLLHLSEDRARLRSVGVDSDDVDGVGDPVAAVQVPEEVDRVDRAVGLGRDEHSGRHQLRVGVDLLDHPGGALEELGVGAGVGAGGPEDGGVRLVPDLPGADRLGFDLRIGFGQGPPEVAVGPVALGCGGEEVRPGVERLVVGGRGIGARRPVDRGSAEDEGNRLDAPGGELAQLRVVGRPVVSALLALDRRPREQQVVAADPSRGHPGEVLVGGGLGRRDAEERAVVAADQGGGLARASATQAGKGEQRRAQQRRQGRSPPPGAHREPRRIGREPSSTIAKVSRSAAPASQGSAGAAIDRPASRGVCAASSSPTTPGASPVSGRVDPRPLWASVSPTSTPTGFSEYSSTAALAASAGPAPASSHSVATMEAKAPARQRMEVLGSTMVDGEG